MNPILKFILTAVLMVFPLSIRAVTTEEMEQARTVTAKWYLRYMNNGSDYLEKLSPSNMSELESNLKAKEKENIKTFKQLAAFPPDYKSWDKEQLVNYWSSTFFSASAVPAEAKKARVRVKNKLNELEIKAVEAPQPEQPQPVVKADTVVKEDPVVQEVVMEEVVAQDTAQMEEMTDPQEETASEESDSSTMIYIIILVIAIIAVAGLVIYAMNAMKTRDNGKDAKDEDENDDIEEELEELRNKLARTVAEKNAVIADLEKRLEIAQQKVSMLEKGDAIPKSYRERNVPQRPEREVYLARANSKGMFVRADSSFSMGNSIFKLMTSDGLTGTFSVIDDLGVFEVALMMPEYLMTACSGRNLQHSEGMKGIVTDTPGTAVFEDGCWRVMRKAAIHYTR